MRALRAIIFILICIGLIWLGIVLIMRAFSSGGEGAKAPAAQKQLIEYANTDAVVSLYVDGPVDVSQDHNAFRITVDRSQSQAQMIKGYDGQVVDQRTYANSSTGFAEFLSALDGLGFTKGTNQSSTQNDRSLCPLGNKYTLDISTAAGQLYHYWTTTCGGGTYGGIRANTVVLFRRQIPNSDLLKMANGFSF